MIPLKVIVFVDEANAAGAARQLDRRINWKEMAEYLADPEEGRMLVEMVLYKGLPPNLPQFQCQRDKQLKYVYALRSQGFIVVTKDGMPQDPGSSSYKANMDVDMAIDAMEMCADMKPDVAVLLTGDADFACLAQKIRRCGVRCEVASARGVLSSELKTAASSVIDLTPLYETFSPWRVAVAAA